MYSEVIILYYKPTSVHRTYKLIHTPHTHTHIHTNAHEYARIYRHTRT